MSKVVKFIREIKRGSVSNPSKDDLICRAADVVITINDDIIKDRQGTSGRPATEEELESARIVK